MGKLWLGIRSVGMTVLFPGIVVGYLPYRILAPVRVPQLDEWSWAQYGGIAAVAMGASALVWCIWAFAHHGRGTLAPFDEPPKMVVKGPYRYVRNPMYAAVVLILLGESSVFSSAGLLLYTSLFFVVFNVFIIGFEEPRLLSKHGTEYVEYSKQVGRWLP